MKPFNENQSGSDRVEPGSGEPADSVSTSSMVSSRDRRRSNRRLHPRYAVEGDAEVILADGTQLFRGNVVDISLSGCFIETKARLRMAIGTPVEMVFRANDLVLRVNATVRALRPGLGAGFLFETLIPRIQCQLEILIETLDLQDPSVPCIVIPPGRRNA